MDNLKGKVCRKERARLSNFNFQALSTLKEDATKFKDELQKTQEALKTAQADLETGRKGWNELEALLKKEKEQTLERIKELQAQNDILHDQIEALGAKLSCVHQQVCYIIINI